MIFATEWQPVTSGKTGRNQATFFIDPIFRTLSREHRDVKIPPWTTSNSSAAPKPPCKG